MIQGLWFMLLRWAYQAKVMKTLLQISRPILVMIGFIRFSFEINAFYLDSMGFHKWHMRVFLTHKDVTTEG